jgi:tripartite-type tricarboxylate transporter receptor subunit TctC
VSPQVAPSNIGELIAEARKAPEKWTFATSALGAPGHLAELDFNLLAGLNLLIQPYRGTAPALNDVAGGHVQLMIDPVLALLPLANSKQVKGLAVTTAKRTLLAPDYPTALGSEEAVDRPSRPAEQDDQRRCSGAQQRKPACQARN